MTSTQKKKHNKGRTTLLLQKLRAPKGWTIEALLAYCQGRAYDAALEDIKAENAPQITGKLRGKVLTTGLLAMIKELSECVSALKDEKD